jgi:putative pyruvate formate lyase activating enzyme
MNDRPAYLALHESGELAERARRTHTLLRRCMVCAQNCRIDRTAGELGVCRVGELAQVASYGPHFGEERPLVGHGGSGTIFFAGCNLSCVYCQNYDISQPARSLPEWEMKPERIAEMMLRLQSSGCENINFVSPSHVVPQILAALVIAAGQGLRLPLVYNSGGYDQLHTLRLLDGVIDIYMPDMKYGDEAVGLRLSGVEDYVTRNRVAVREMHRQVGDLQQGERGVAHRGLLVRHLVLPDGLAGTPQVARFLAEEISPDTYINVMDQYRPAHRAARWKVAPRPLAAASGTRIARPRGTPARGRAPAPGPPPAAAPAPGAPALEAAPSCDAICRAPTPAEFHAAMDQVLGAGLWRIDGLEPTDRGVFGSSAP